jgi:hypothetical protein
MPSSVRRLAAAFAFLVFSGTPGVAAPALKDPPKDREPNLQAIHELIRKTVEDGKALPDWGEQRTTDTLRTLLARVSQLAETPDRELPAKFDALKKSDAAKEFRQTRVEKELVVGGEVRGTLASHSIILASGDVQFTSLDHCVVVGKTVRFTGARNCVIIGEEFVRGTGVGGGKDQPDGSVIVSGRWIRLTTASDAVLHVLRPGTDPSPDDRKGENYPPIRLTVAQKVQFLNKSDNVGTTRRTDCRCLELKSPLAK